MATLRNWNSGPTAARWRNYPFDIYGLMAEGVGETKACTTETSLSQSKLRSSRDLIGEMRVLAWVHRADPCSNPCAPIHLKELSREKIPVRWLNLGTQDQAVNHGLIYLEDRAGGTPHRVADLFAVCIETPGHTMVQPLKVWQLTADFALHVS